MRILVTGAAGFIGSKVMYELARRGDFVVGVDNINDYYDPKLKYARLQRCGILSNEAAWDSNIVKSTLFDNCLFIRISIADKPVLDKLFARYHFDKVINLAAQAGVRYSITHPYSYMQSNLYGFLNIMEACRNYNIKHLIFASSSSVYGMNSKTPFSEDDKVTTPVSLYAASKKSNELMAHCYSKLYGFATTGLRYFTVYGPWGRPDMSPMLFATAISKGEPIKVFNNGNMMRDFTYIDDIVEGTIRVIDSATDRGIYENSVPYRIYNIGCSRPVKLMDFIHEIEAEMGKEAQKIYLPMQQGDVYMTYADTTRLENELEYKPHVTLHEGIRKFVEWFKSEDNPLDL
ncbi:NAD-dependent epimerase/dehydratase family protein [Prevotella sp. kh1p2]|uniref:NAD-dependent epimerase/dehydratase family protein n=1 Tax=Prevotella sp. kh1p2 TaxID=1761883 RepID=UPI0008C15435|nr:NAD-dependent epimerase/dehydratase family protein [Prevotella sp. kh1p2]SET11634.1 UDP-glucuronate 4-epimerase [Prevotella sp. kh1p2]SNU11799.1 UDP-glucuronate 4-epimerase [Prevotellaceae bacterium KH2P17]